jgi:hypothetical protein
VCQPWALSGGGLGAYGIRPALYCRIGTLVRIIHDSHVSGCLGSLTLARSTALFWVGLVSSFVFLKLDETPDASHRSHLFWGTDKKSRSGTTTVIGIFKLRFLGMQL